MNDLVEPLYAEPDVAQFYDFRGAARPDLAFCGKLAGNARSVLDLGCGTGELAALLSAGRRVVGVDPAAAMLDSRAPAQMEVRWTGSKAMHARSDLMSVSIWLLSRAIRFRSFSPKRISAL
ncbi:class I SAM-dependent methyltransferase [Nitratireductor sp. L15S-10]|uniref:class I SAM-dependent methyltransferase n=1 Tax=Nitratireductor sp. L15S-10 TaxID=3034028 RepID=UPI00385737DD